MTEDIPYGLSARAELVSNAARAIQELERLVHKQAHLEYDLTQTNQELNVVRRQTIALIQAAGLAPIPQEELKQGSLPRPTKKEPLK